MIPDPHDILVEDYQKNVIPHLIPGVSENLLTSSGSGPNYFEIELGSDFTTGTPYDVQGTRFIHFTSLKALHSIINENSIRLYSLKNVNDPNELDFFTEGLLPSEMMEDIQSNTYILSLCDVTVLEKKNILNLWRLYGNQGFGVAIEFEIEFKYHSSMDCYYLGKVIYDKPNLEMFIKEDAAFKVRNSVNVEPENLIRVPASFHKNPYYSVEEEVRLMYFKEHSTRKATSSLEKVNKFKWDFNARNELVTYHTLDIGDWVTIKRIQIGFRHSEEAFNAIKNHFTDIYRYKSTKYWTEYDELLKKDVMAHPAQYLGEETSTPIIEHSPLKNIYR